MTNLAHIQVGDLVTHVEQRGTVGLVLRGPLHVAPDASFTDDPSIVPWSNDPAAGDWWEVSWAVSPTTHTGTAHRSLKIYHGSVLARLVRPRADT